MKDRVMNEFCPTLKLQEDNVINRKINGYFKQHGQMKLEVFE